MICSNNFFIRSWTEKTKRCSLLCDVKISPFANIKQRVYRKKMGGARFRNTCAWKSELFYGQSTKYSCCLSVALKKISSNAACHPEFSRGATYLQLAMLFWCRNTMYYLIFYILSKCNHIPLSGLFYRILWSFKYYSISCHFRIYLE